MSAEGTQAKRLPAEFIAFHARGARLEGFVSSATIGYFQLWPLTEIETLNNGYNVAEYAPDLLAFGSNGGADMLAFNQQEQILLVPFIGMETEYAILVANSWTDFERILSL
ncbi:MAG: SMI1/KNR4 family protein [Steroidobacteraceae bacterium]